MSRQANRLPPVGPVGAYQTFQMVRPRATHSRPATCAEVECPHYLNGWACRVIAGSDDEALIRRTIAARSYRYLDVREDGGFIRFMFYPEQPCFKAGAHRVQLDRPGIYLVKDGDWRGNPTGRTRRHANGDDWVDDFANHQEKIKEAIEHG